MPTHFTRRTVIGTLLSATGAVTVSAISGCGGTKQSGVMAETSLTPPQPLQKSLLDSIGVLGSPDANDVKLPAGFTSRIVARSGQAAASNASYIWHGAPDGGAVFEQEDGGWIYVSNAELPDATGGVGALVFNASGEVIDSYPILDGTNKNCAGGATPWGTWLSCEETAKGQVWECDPTGKTAAIVRPALGVFNHEAVAVDPATNILYLTEDRKKGLFYRFIPSAVDAGNRPDLSAGILQAAKVHPDTGAVSWIDIADPSAAQTETRRQAPGATTFNGGEGVVFYDNVVSFTTKGDNRVWAYQTDNEVMSLVYDRATAQNPILSGVDNITVSQDGELIVSEDGGDLQIVAITASGRLVPLMQLAWHDESEITGPAFSPDGKRLYFSSQRGRSGYSEDGVTYEVSGPFHA